MSNSAVVVPMEAPDEIAIVADVDAPRRGRGSRAIASMGLAGLVWRSASDERVRARVSRLVAEIERLRHRGELARRQRRRRRVVAGVLASAGASAGAVATVRALSSAPIEEAIEVDVPVSQAYNQWTQFEEFPNFMNGVEQVRQLDDTHLHWVASVGGQTREWDAEISEQRPDERIAWHSLAGKRNAGVVTFHRLADQRSKIVAQLDYEPTATREKIGHALGVDRRRVRGDLKRFKQLIEERPHETGAWRGEVDAGERVD